MIHNNVLFILYVKNQDKSKEFYKSLLMIKPRLDVPGMTEFELFNGVVLGLMPENGIVRLLEGKIINPEKANGIPRSEVYLYVDNPDYYYQKLIELGGKGISSSMKRSWGDVVAYGSDLDGHIIAFAKSQSV